MWGCIPELTKDCIDMTNAGSTYFGLIMGAILGGIINWWIYNRQKKISEEQDNLLVHIKDLEENNKLILQRENILKREMRTFNDLLAREKD